MDRRYALSSGDGARERQTYTESVELAARPLPATAARRARSFVQTPWILIVGFAAIILLGTLLLKLPWSAAPGKHVSWVDALFTATSAVTITGLTVVSTVGTFSYLGQFFILLLLQVGGVGFISFSVLFFRLIGRRVTLDTRYLVQEELFESDASRVVRLALYLLGVTLTFEAIGAVLLFLRWRTVMPAGEAAWNAVFHAVSAYCNAGFDLFSGADKSVFFGFGTDVISLSVLGSLIILGGLGVPVLYDVWGYLRGKDRTLSLYTRLTLTLMVALNLVGALLFLLDGRFHSNMYPDTPLIERVFAGTFTVVSARTAGVTIMPLDQLTNMSQLLILFWMFIGAAPASMAGGVSTSTVGVLLASVVATARGRSDAVAFHRTLPFETIAKAVAIMTVSTLLVAVVTMLLSIEHQGNIFRVGFETVSAFSNTGYSLAMTDKFSVFGRLLLAFTMFWGRLGPLTIVIALAQREEPTLIHYPDERVPLG